MRRIIVGDVHGCYDELCYLLGEVNFDVATDELWSIGDLVDKGPHPDLVVRLFRDAGGKLVRGNHEDKHIRYWKHEQNKLKPNPMKPNEEFLRTHAKLRSDDLSWLDLAQKRVELFGGKVLLVHAGPEPKKEMHLRYVTRDRGEYVQFNGEFTRPPNAVHWSDRYTGQQTVVYGHHPWKQIRCVGDTIGIDTGCVYGNRLSAAIFEDRDAEPLFYSVPARRAYAEGHPE